jgi:hypothetical protein
MSYVFDLNDRLMNSLVGTLDRADLPLSSCSDDFIKKTIKKELTTLDKLYIFINPTQHTAQFKWNDRKIAKASEGFHGKAKRLFEKNLDHIQKKMNQQMIIESHNQFNSIESILDFAYNNEELLNLLARDTDFYLRFSEKIDQLIEVAETREKTLAASDHFFSKLSNAVQAQGWKTQSDRARDIKSELHDKMTGRLSADEVRAIFRRRNHLKSFEEMRVYINLRNITHYQIDILREDIGLENFLENGIKSPISLN